jgi:2-polyprenyl-3-methyl-5-hydroxy-6-metoxy-1,4-benzoquinol methylase
MSRIWSQELFEHLPQSYQPSTTSGTTLREVDFIEQEIGYDRSKSILDVGCGAGRHSLELARRGYQVVGLDLSPVQLKQAQTAAREEHLAVEFINQDARALNFYDRFQVALLMCEGAFSLMETDEMDWLILRNIARALQPGGRFILTVPNAAYLLTHEPTAGTFDMLTFRENFTLNTSSDGMDREIQCSQRYYTCPEMRWLLRQSGFQKVAFFAVTPKGLDKDQKPDKDHFELGILADK